MTTFVIIEAMARVIITSEAQREFDELPVTIMLRVTDVFKRLRKWPQVSGAKPLRHGLKGSFRIRTGDYRVLFNVEPAEPCVTVYRIAHRRDAYE